jgi:hypothetical protein
LSFRIFAIKRDFGKTSIPLKKSIKRFDCLIISIKRFKNKKGLSEILLSKQIKIAQFKNGKSIKLEENFNAS